MESKTDIGKAFREKLGQLHKQPGDSVWDSIRGDLDKGTAKGTPSWIKLTAVAALFLLTGIITYPEWENHVPHIYMKMPDNNTDGNSTTTSSPNGIVTNDKDGTEGSPQNSPDAIGGTDTKNTTENNINYSQRDSQTATDELADSESDGIISQKKTPKNTVTVNPGHQSGTTIISGSNSTGKDPAQNSNNSGSGNSKSGKTNTNATGVEGQKNADAKNNDTALPPPFKVSVDTQTDPIYRNYRNNTSSAVPKDSTDTKQQQEPVKADSLTAVPAGGKRAGKPIAVENKEIKRFSLYAFVAPTGYNLPSNGGYLDMTLSDNESSSTTSLAFGGYVGYNLTAGTAVRIGIIKHKTELSSDNIYMSEELMPIYYSGIEYLPGIDNDMVRQQLGQTVDESGNILALVNLRHQFEFLEIPVEVSYRINSNKLGLSVIGGLNTLFTTTNTVYASNEVGKIRLGEYAGTEKVNFGISAGARLSYEVVNNLQINVEPIIKYYLKDDGFLNPLTYTLQAGLQYNFDLQKKS